MELRHLRYIVAAAHHRSLHKAADVLHMKQSTLSRYIREVEDELGAALFDRGPRGTVVTELGEEFLAYAQQMLEDLDFAAARVKNHSKGRTGRLIIGLYTSSFAPNLRAIFHEQKSRRPEIKLPIMNRARTYLLAALRAGTLDVAIMPDDRSEWDGGKHRLWSERVVLGPVDKVTKPKTGRR